MPTRTDAEYAAQRRDRIETIQRDGAIRRVVCPTCEAQPGEDCHTLPGYWPSSPHADRKRLAQ